MYVCVYVCVCECVCVCESMRVALWMIGQYTTQGGGMYVCV
jgi:hypothetical protein